MPWPFSDPRRFRVPVSHVCLSLLPRRPEFSSGVYAAKLIVSAANSQFTDQTTNDCDLRPLVAPLNCYPKTDRLPESLRNRSPSVRENVRERFAMQLRERETGHLDRCLLSNRTAIHRALEAVQRALPGRRIIVTNLAGERCRRRLSEQVPQTFRCGVETLEEKCVD